MLLNFNWFGFIPEHRLTNKYFSTNKDKSTAAAAATPLPPQTSINDNRSGSIKHNNNYVYSYNNIVHGNNIKIKINKKIVFDTAVGVVVSI